MSPQRSDHLSWVKPVHRNRTATRHKHKLRTTAPRYGKLEAFATLIHDFPIVHLLMRNKDFFFLTNEQIRR